MPQLGVQWHPFHETEFATGGADGCINFWAVGTDFALGGLEYAHEQNGQPTQIWTLDWHPLGHVLVSGSNDHTTRFWTRNRVGEPMLDRFGYGFRAEGTWVPGVFGRVPGAPAPQIVLPGGLKVETEKSSQEEDDEGTVLDSVRFHCPLPEARAFYTLVYSLSCIR